MKGSVQLNVFLSLLTIILNYRPDLLQVNYRLVDDEHWIIDYIVNCLLHYLQKGIGVIPSASHPHQLLNYHL